MPNTSVTDGVVISGATASVGVVLLNPDGLVPVGGTSLTDSDLRASHLDVQQVSGSSASVNVLNTSLAVTATALDIRSLLNASDSIASYQVSGANWSVSLSNASVAASIVDSTGIQYSGSNPIPISGNIGTVTTVTGVTNSVASAIIDSSGVQYSTANPIPITIVTSATASVNVALTDSSGVQYSGSNGLPITGTVTVLNSVNTTAVNIVDSTGVAYEGGNAFPITVVTSATASVNTALTDSGGVQYSGSNPVPITWVSGAGATVGAANIDSSGVQYSGSNPFPITIVTSATASVNTALTDSSGIQYSGSNPLPITGNVNVNGALNSVLSTGPSASGVADDGSAPNQVGGIVRTANPTKVAGGSVAKYSADAIGRQLFRPTQVRELVATSYTALSTGTETTLVTAAAGTLLDLIAITFSSNSTIAVTVDLRASAAGSIVHTANLQANSQPYTWTPAVPYPQNDTGNAWTADMPDITGTTVHISGLFSKEL